MFLRHYARIWLQRLRVLNWVVRTPSHYCQTLTKVDLLLAQTSLLVFGFRPHSFSTPHFLSSLSDWSSLSCCFIDCSSYKIPKHILSHPQLIALAFSYSPHLVLSLFWSSFALLILQLISDLSALRLAWSLCPVKLDLMGPHYIACHSWVSLVEYPPPCFTCFILDLFLHLSRFSIF